MLQTPVISAQPLLGLARIVTWRASLTVSLGALLQVVVAAGPMAAEIGHYSVLVWIGTAIVGLLQCLLLAELASRFPNKAGGTATYAHEAFKNSTPILGALSGWSYWLGWTPGIAVNVLLAGQYLHTSFVPHVNATVLAILLAAGIYALNAWGLCPSLRLSVVLAICVLIPLGAIALSPLLGLRVISIDSFSPHPSGLTLVKWMFVASWASYGAEMASSVVSEMRDPGKDAPRGLISAALTGLLAYGAVPAALLALLGPAGLAQDPSIAFLPALKALLGPIGGALVTLMLVAALVLGAQSFLIGSSRTLFEMSRDGLIPAGFGRLSKGGAPIGSLIWDGAVITTLLIVFGDKILSLVAAANVGYLVVFILLPVAYLKLRRSQASEGAFRLPFAFVPIAVVLTVFNLFLLVIGGPQWGCPVMLTGTLLLLTFLPFYGLTRYRDKSEPL